MKKKSGFTFITNAIIEMPAGISYKYEMDESSGRLILDRPLKVQTPYNYGFIPNTLAGDKDPLDIFVISHYPIHPGAQIKVKPNGIIFGKDGNQADNKIIGILHGEKETEFNWPLILDSCASYLQNYKKGYKILKRGGFKAAMKEITDCKLQYSINIEDLIYETD